MIRRTVFVVETTGLCLGLIIGTSEVGCSVERLFQALGCK